jgi:UDP-N-acetylglucosamine 1-carboxyvinyltransferase
MATLRIEGGRRLAGRVAVEGNKNSALPLIAACLLTDQPCEISNVPRIRDVEVLLEILSGLGATIEGAGTSTLRITCGAVTGDRPDPILVGKLRGSVLLLGPLLARKGSARLAQPGGDFPARRTIATRSPHSEPCRSRSPGTRWRLRGV